MKKISANEWAQFSEKAHLVGFSEKRPAEMDRIDYALLALDLDDSILGWVTVRELDMETVYWQFGAGLPTILSSPKAVEVFGMLKDYCLSQYKRVTMLIENTNVKCMKVAMHHGFRVVGCRFFEGQVFVEFLNNGKT